MKYEKIIHLSTECLCIVVFVLVGLSGCVQVHIEFIQKKKVEKKKEK